MPPAQRFWAWHLGVPLLWGLGTWWLMTQTRIDEHVSAYFYDASMQYFPHSREWLFDQGFHIYGRLPTWLALLVAIGLLVASRWKASLQPWRRRLAYLLVSMATGSALVSVLKHTSNVFCPRDLQMFGGTDPFHWPFQVAVTHGVRHGECWPAGHASYGFVLLSVYFMLRDTHRRWAFASLVMALLWGHILGFSRVMQGAHFLSHQCWTALFCWLAALAWYRVLLYRRTPGALSGVA